MQEAPQAPAIRGRMLAVPHREALGFGRGQQRQGQQPAGGFLLLLLRPVHLLLQRLVAVFSCQGCQERVLLRPSARRAGADVPEQVGGGGGGEAGAAGERGAEEERDGVLVQADEGGD